MSGSQAADRVQAPAPAPASASERAGDGWGPGRFSGKVAVVAGVARPPGIGYRTALRLARGGASVVCADAVAGSAGAGAGAGVGSGGPAGPARGASGTGSYDTGIVSAELLAEVTAEVGLAAGDRGRAVSFAADPWDQRSWEEAAALAVDTFGRIDLCCALMGTTGPSAGDGPLLDVEIESWRRCLDVNVTAPLLLARACARPMIDHGGGGAIVILSSYSAVVPSIGNGAIASARSAVNRLTEVLALELAPHGVRVNAVLPLGVQSGDDRFPNPGLQRLADSGAPSLSAWASHQVPLGRPQSADETAAVIEFLCSPDASFVTGVGVPVAGGSHSHM